jgi:hypothetical protein
VKNIPRLVLIVAAAAVMTACASSADASNIRTPSSPSPAPKQARIAKVDPCALVTAADASKAAGKTLVNSVTLGASPVAGGCFYGARGTSAGVYVYTQVYPDAATADAVTVDQLESVMAGRLGSATGDATQIAGIGDRAFEFTANGAAGKGMAIVVYRSNVVFVIAMAPATEESTVQDLAKTAVSRVH